MKRYSIKHQSTVMKKKYLFIILLLLIFGVCGVVYKNMPLRNAIFRSFAMGNTFLISEADTVYSFGYYGVRKSVINNDKLSILAENDEFVNNCFVGRLVGRSGIINGDYIYVAARSSLGGDYVSHNENYIDGKLLVLRKKDLSIVQEIKSDIKLIEVKMSGNHIIVTGLKGFDIYDISRPDSLTVTYMYRSERFTEFQGLELFDVDSCSYIAFARFAEGISIWDMSDPKNPYVVKDIAIQDTLVNGNVLPKGLQNFRIKLNYPYLYATLAPMSGYFGKKEDLRGIMVYDLSDINNIKSKVCLIPKEDYYTTKTGDPEPTHLDIYENRLYVNFGEKGVAVFNVTQPFNPIYENIVDANNDGAMILPLHINHRGILFIGDYYWPDIYFKKLDEQLSFTL